ncbi:MAG: Lipid-A-disaccharide synthase [Deltaproteobacteria bacterium ADurb.Bin510]|nr:MAG: Lipid-A-disaccharide synthase [Deltaproteobacteria bacterium ADurb.Bin510]
MKVMLVAGEASADKHAARVIEAIRRREPDAEFFGLGGPAMQAAGMQCHFSMQELDILRIKDALQRLIDLKKPDLLIPVDSPDFNMRLMPYAKARGVKVLYYIAPQAWAWRPGRASQLAQMTDGLAVIFPFEEEFFRSHGVNAHYVGHPFMENPPELVQLSWPPKRVALLPGSRRQELSRMLEDMLAAKRILDKRHPWLKWYLPLAPGLDRQVFDHIADDNIEIVGELPEVDLSLTKSGTVSFEMALRGVPEVICYRTSNLNYRLAKRFVKMEHIGMPNIILGRTVVPELIQHDLTPLNLADRLTEFMNDSIKYMQVRTAFEELRAKLGNLKASEGVAAWAQAILTS